MLTCIREKPWGSRLANGHKLSRCGQPRRSTVQIVSVCPFARRDPQPPSSTATPPPVDEDSDEESRPKTGKSDRHGDKNAMLKAEK